MVSWLVRSFGIINSLAQIIFESQIVWGGRNETQFRPRNFQIWKIEYYEPLFSLLFNCFISLFPYSTNYKLITLFLVYLVLIHYLSFVVYTSENCFGSPFIKQSPQIVWSVAPPPPRTLSLIRIPHYDVQIDVYGITVNVSYIFLHIATYIDTLIRDSSPFSGIEHPFTVLQWFRQPVPGWRSVSQFAFSIPPKNAGLLLCKASQHPSFGMILVKIQFDEFSPSTWFFRQIKTLIRCHLSFVRYNELDVYIYI